ncbi:MAG: capsular biosynthesis protein [Betaproteobacteria bacterium]|nr:capsular biosynthesis protein [Betaproteobacteria bacterium]
MFVFPMLGRSSRFFNAGYTVPKYKLPLGVEGQVVFDHVLGSFRRYFDTDLFVLLCRADTHDQPFLIERMHAIGVRRFEVIEHAGETGGQAESVELSLARAPQEEELFIFNIDTVLYNFEKDSARGKVAGYLEVFRGDGTHWSFVEPNPDRPGHAGRVVEKERISDLCSNGLYYFATVRIFKEALDAYRLKHHVVAGELYVAPLYNELIERGQLVSYKLVPAEEIGFCGVPDEYVELSRTLS